MSKQLSEECIKAIDEEAEGRYPVLTHNNPLVSPYIGSKKTFIHGVNYALTNPEIYTKADLIHKDEVKDLIEENKYLKAEFEANKEKVYTQEEMDKAKQKSFDKGWKNGWAEAVDYKL